jgi:hypothetical protein
MLKTHASRLDVPVFEKGYYKDAMEATIVQASGY